jgi:hypothetical protein
MLPAEVCRSEYARCVTLLVAGCAAKLDLGGEGAAGVLVGRHMVVLEEFAASAVDAHSVSFFDEASLAAGGVAVPVGGVDGVAS